MNHPEILDDPGFWAKVNADGDCWVWVGHRDADGQPRIRRKGRSISARLYLYERAVRPLVPGERLKPTCALRACVNPDHYVIRTVTPR